LVIDNNTTDPQLWRPVEEFCRELGPRFRFFHVENLKGFKAGALNYVRRFMDPRAEFIFVVDADYVVEPKCLRRALAFWTDPKIGLIQFPQDYRNIGNGNWGVALDFKHYFAAYMNMANRLECVPSTGTLSLINVDALRAVDGFSEQMITEDADIGFRLALQGYKSIYGL
jgi:cellulose synthase/poly-beta-1,6-N-acetylglucosamine synthase-like glycosyltransferase